jgi:hypothetical protein
MIAAQLIAAHNATMECYRRAMIGQQTLEGRRDNLSQANKLSRTYAVLLDALNRFRRPHHLRPVGWQYGSDQPLRAARSRTYAAAADADGSELPSPHIHSLPGCQGSLAFTSTRRRFV